MPILLVKKFLYEDIRVYAPSPKQYLTIPPLWRRPKPNEQTPTTLVLELVVACKGPPWKKLKEIKFMFLEI